MRFAPYAHFETIAARRQWDETAVDLREDAAAWPRLPPQARERIGALIAAFVLAETAVTAALDPFGARTGDRGAAACFAAQQGDEARHARFFGRVAAEVIGGAPGPVAPAVAELFERRLPAMADALARAEVSLAEATALYHLLLEGVVFSAGQTALLALLDEHPGLGGTREGLERVVADERWHIGFGARVLADAGISPAVSERLAGEGETVAAAWGDAVPSGVRAHAVALHRRRLRAAGLGV